MSEALDLEPLRSLLGLVPDAAVLVTATGELLAQNERARALLEIAPGASLPDATNDGPAFRSFLRICARSPQPLPGSLGLCSRAASKTTVYAAAGALVSRRTDSAPAIVAVRFWPRDAGSPFLLLTQKIAELNEEVKRRRHAEDALRASEARLREHAEQLESASLMKDEFLATVSHELRTPLNSILGWSVMLRTGEIDPASVERALQTIERNARAQAHIVDDLLDVSRIVTGQVRLEVAQFDPIVAIEAALDAIRPAADAKGVRLQRTLDPAAGPIMGDPARIQQVLWNLLSNAVKFTPKGGRVQILLRNVQSAVEIEVIDTGAGIDVAFLPHVFEPFRQQDQSPTRRHGGLGLGLTISRRLVELHGGTIEATSEGEGHGARFALRLPRAVLRIDAPERWEPAPAHVDPSVPCPSEIEGSQLLIVDDEPDSLALLAALFARCGATVAAASDAEEALALLTSSRPQVIVSDIGMPRVDGYELIRRVRSLDPELGGRTPAVALTAYARSEDRTAALRAGFDAHVAKPVEPRELLALVARLVDRR